MDKICGKNAIVFGGSGGIAMEINKVLLENGVANLVLVDIQDPHQELKDFMGNHKNVLYEKGSVADKDVVCSVLKKYFDQLGYIDILINAAGVTTESNIDLHMQVNAVGPMNSCTEALKYMGKNKGGKGGTIINIASVVGLMVRYTTPSYCASKHALVAFSQCLMEEPFYQLTGVKVHVLCPGLTQTPFLNDRHKETVFPEFEEVLKNLLKSNQFQPASKVAEAVMIALKDDSIGAVWINDNGKTYKVKIPEIYNFGINN